MSFPPTLITTIRSPGKNWRRFAPRALIAARAAIGPPEVRRPRRTAADVAAPQLQSNSSSKLSGLIKMEMDNSIVRSS